MSNPRLNRLYRLTNLLTRLTEWPRLVQFPEQTNLIAKDQPQYRPLPAYVFKNDPEGKIICCWKFSWKDRLRILFGLPLWHTVLTFNHPLQPQLLQCDRPTMPYQPDWPRK